MIHFFQNPRQYAVAQPFENVRNHVQKYMHRRIRNLYCLCLNKVILFKFETKLRMYTEVTKYLLQTYFHCKLITQHE